MQKACGIYLITCRPPGGLPLYYVGQSQNVALRFGQHRSALRCGSHFNDRLQRSWDKYGAETFSFEVLEFCQKQELDAAELWWLEQMVGYRRCFNVGTDPVAPQRGRKFSEEHKRKIAAAVSGNRHYAFGKNLAPEHRAKISASGKGLTRSAETRRRISLANAGERNSMHGMSGSLNLRSKPVQGVSIETGLVIRFESACLAEQAGFDQGAISRVCRGISRVHKGYVWSFVDPMRSA